MAESVVPGPISDLSAVREATCVHTMKIFDSCHSKDCIEDLRLYPMQSSQCAIDQADTIKACRAKLLYVLVNVESTGLNRGFYTIDLRYFYKITAEAITGCARSTPISGLAVFDKRAVLFGSESGAKVFSSENGCGDLTRPLPLGRDDPLAVVEAVDPVVLNFKLCCAHDCPRCGENVIAEIPCAISASFDEPISLDNSTAKRIYVSLGQFSILRLERDTQLLLPIYDYCMPDKECTCDSCANDPCDIFQQITFPVGQFFPPAAACDMDPLNELRRHCSCQ